MPGLKWMFLCGAGVLVSAQPLIGQRDPLELRPGSSQPPSLDAWRVASFSGPQSLSSTERVVARGLMPANPTTRGALIGGAAGLAISAILTVIYVESTDPGNYSGSVLPIIVGTGAVGAVIGAAIGARWEAEPDR